MLRDLAQTNPLVIIFLGMVAGIALVNTDWTLLSFCAFFVVFSSSKKIVIPLLLGGCIGIVSLAIAPQWHDIPEGTYDLEGRVVSAGFSHSTYRIVLSDVSINTEKIRGHVRLSVYKHIRKLDRGSNIRTRALLRPVKAFGNIDEFNYTRYLLSEGIVLNGNIKDFNDIKVIKSARSHSFRLKAVELLADMSRPEAEVLKAVLTGDKSGLAYCLRDIFASLGIAHMLAISGLHMGLVILFGYMACFTIIRLIPGLAVRLDSPLIAKLFGLLCATVFVWFVGSSAPTIRAVIMAGVLIGSLIFVRKVDLLSSLALAGIFILIVWPFSVYSYSFLLSFIAVLGIIGVLKKLENKPKWLQALSIPIVATGFTLPLVAYGFGLISPAGFIFNLVFVPFFSLVIMPLGLLGLLVLRFSESAALYLFSLSMDGIACILQVGLKFGKLSAVPRPQLIWVFLCYMGLILAFFGRRTPVRKGVLLGICLAIAVIPLAQYQYRKAEPLTFDFISVGHGDCSLVTKNGHAILIDSGGSVWGFDTGRFVVLPHLLRRGLTKLDLVIITHSHPDHIGGMPYILKRINVCEVWTNVAEDWNQHFKDVKQITKVKSIPITSVSLGDEKEINDIKIEVLNPQVKIAKRSVNLDLNLHSVVVRIGDGSLRGLFMADADRFGELSLVHLGRDISADVLKVAHHGGPGSCQNVFLEKVHPLVAVISCGSSGRYSGPNLQALMRLSNNKICTYSTNCYGEVFIRKKKGIITVKSGIESSDR